MMDRPQPARTGAGGELMDPTDPKPKEINELIDSIRAELAQRKARLENGDAQPVTHRPVYAWGSDLRFHQNGGAEAYLLSGWSEPEPEHRWSNGDRAEMEIPVEPGQADLLLEIEGYALQADPAVAQRIRVLADGRLSAEWSAGGPATHHALILRSRVGKNGRLRLAFEFPDAVSPAEIGLAEDHRKLGIAVRRLSLRPLES